MPKSIRKHKKLNDVLRIVIHKKGRHHFFGMLTAFVIFIAYNSVNAQAAPNNKISLVKKDGMVSHRNYVIDHDDRLFQIYLNQPNWKTLIQDELANFLPHTHDKQRSRTKGSIWIHIKLENDLQAASEFALSFHPSATRIDVFQIDAASIVHTSTFGSEHPSLNKVFYRFPSFIDKLAPQEKAEYLFRIQTSYILSSKINFYDLETKSGSIFAEHLFIASYYGFMLALLLYNLFLFFSTRIRTYLYYILFIVSVCIANTAGDGMIKLLIGHFPENSFFIFAIVGTIAVLFFGLNFVDKLLSASKHSRFLKITNRFIYLYIAILAIFATAQNYHIFDVTNLSIILIGIYLIGIGVYFAIKGSKPAMLFLLGWVVLIVCAAASSLTPYLMDTNNKLQVFLIYFGSAFDVLMASFALGQKIKEANEEQAKNKIKAKEADKLQKLVHVLAHDVSNPLNVIIAQAKLLEIKKYPQEKMKEAWLKVQRACDSIFAILESVRNLEAVRTGKMKPKIEKVSFNESFDHANFIFTHDLERKKVALRKQIEADDQEDLFFSSNKQIFATSILNNLISNAIKFSRENDVITVLAKIEDERICIEVQDQGVGIPPQIVKDLFQSDKETSRTGTHGEKGTGFGLPLVHAFIQSLGGEIKVISHFDQADSKNHGTTFFVYFPLWAEDRNSADQEQ